MFKIISALCILIQLTIVQIVNASWQDAYQDLMRPSVENKNENKGFFNSVKSGIDEGKRIIKGEPKIEEINMMDGKRIKAEGSLTHSFDNDHMFTINLYNSSSWVVTGIEYVLETNGDTYSGTISCGAINPKQSGSCKGYVNIFKIGPKWDYSLTYFGYSEKN